MRYRKIDPRIWNDEAFTRFDPLKKIIWFALLTHPRMTPIGAGVLTVGELDHIIGNYTGGFCWKCSDLCDTPAHHAHGILNQFEQDGQILLDGDLVIVKNYLLYNPPDNAYNTVGWLEWIEELPRSDHWKTLHDHLISKLSEEQKNKIKWFFKGVLEPFCNNKIQGLKENFWERVKGLVQTPKERSESISNPTPPRPPSKPRPDPTPTPLATPPRPLELELELELDKNITHPRQPKPVDMDAVAKMWNEIVSGYDRILPLCKLPLGRQRKTKIKCRLQEFPDVKLWEAAIDFLCSDPFYSGNGGRGWKANIDFLIRSQDTFNGILEKVDVKKQTPTQPFSDEDPFQAIYRKHQEKEKQDAAKRTTDV